MHDKTEIQYLEDNSLKELAAAVNAQIKTGWQPVGPIIYAPGEQDLTWFVQTMVKYKKPRKPAKKLS